MARTSLGGSARCRAFTVAVTALMLTIGTTGSAVGAAPKPPREAKGTAVLEEDFTDAAAAEWLIVDQEPSGAREENGKVVVEVRQPGSGHRVFGPFSFVPPASYAVEADAVHQSGDFDHAAWGVLCRATLDSSYSLTMSRDGYFAIFRIDPETSTRLDDEKDKAAKRRAKKAIKRGARAVNRIRGECFEDGRLRLFVNGKFISEAVDPAPLTGQAFATYLEVGDATELPSVVTFDDFELVDIS